MQEYFAELNLAEQKQVLEIVKTFLAKHDEGDDSISIDQYNQEIDEALAEVAAGNYITQEDLETETAKWHLK
jgi:hypothetical protein